MAGKQNEPNEKEAKAASGMKTETKPEQETETQEEKLVPSALSGVLSFPVPESPFLLWRDLERRR